MSLEKLLEIIVCPVTKTRLELSEDKKELISKAAKLAYPVKNNIPILIRDEARKLDD